MTSATDGNALFSALGLEQIGAGEVPATSRQTLTEERRAVDFTLRFADGKQLDVTLVGSGSEPVWFWLVAESLKRLSRLQMNWDSYSATPLSINAARRSFNLLLAVLPLDAPDPSVVPTRDGGVQFEWHRRGIDIEIEVPPTGAISTFISDSETGFEQDGGLDQAAIRKAFELMSARVKT